MISHLRSVKFSFKVFKGLDGNDAELTPTMKLKRRVIRKKYANEIAEIYNV